MVSYGSLEGHATGDFVIEKNDTKACALNAANEVAVAAFMKEEIPFTAIVDTIEKTVTKLGGQAQSVVRDIKDVSAIENDARRVAQEALAKR